LAFYQGLSAALLRQVVYGSSRLGLFRVFSDTQREQNGGKPLSLSRKTATGMIAGGLASFIGSPADLCLIRFQADQTLPPAQRRNYKNIGDALVRIVREEGILGLWRGASPTVIRAICLNGAMMPVSDQVKETIGPLMGGETSLASSFTSAAASGVASALASLPADVVKTRLQRMVPDPATGKMPYSGFLDCAKKVAQKDGLGAFYAGTGTYIIRIAPHAFITLLILDAISAIKKRWGAAH
jgi:solute carrier family 25 oxoglutarate transporter 11